MAIDVSTYFTPEVYTAIKAGTHTASVATQIQTALNDAGSVGVSKPGTTFPVFRAGAFSTSLVKIFFPPGLYYINGEELLLTGNRNTLIEGDGAIIYQQDPTKSIFRVPNAGATQRIWRNIVLRGGLHHVVSDNPDNVDNSVFEFDGVYFQESHNYSVYLIDELNMGLDICPKLLSIHDSVFVHCSGICRTNADHVVIKDNYFAQCNRGSTQTGRTFSNLISLPSSGGSGPRIIDNQITPHADAINGGFLLALGDPSMSGNFVPHSVVLSGNRIGGESAGIGLLTFDAGQNTPASARASGGGTGIIISANQCEGALWVAPNNVHIRLKGNFRRLNLLNNKFWTSVDTRIFDLSACGVIGSVTHDLDPLELQVLENTALDYLFLTAVSGTPLKQPLPTQLLGADPWAALTTGFEDPTGGLAARRYNSTTITLNSASIAASLTSGAGLYSFIMWAKVESGSIENLEMAGAGLVKTWQPRLIQSSPSRHAWRRYVIMFEYSGSGAVNVMIIFRQYQNPAGNIIAYFYGAECYSGWV